MFKNVFSKLFRPSTQTTPAPPNNTIYNGQSRRPSHSISDPYHSTKYDRMPIYAIPTISAQAISSGGENRKPSGECVENSSQRSTSSMSSSSSTSCQNFASSNKSGGIQKQPVSNNKSMVNNKSVAKSSVATPRLNESSIQQIYIAPHCIHYTNSTSDDTIYRIDDESLNEIAAEILESENSPPKLQIVHYGDRYFAINNSHLQIYKQLQISGLITHVQADVINIEAIPYPLRQHLFQPSFDCIDHLHAHHTRVDMAADDVISDEDLEEAMAVHGMVLNSGVVVDCCDNNLPNRSEIVNSTACSSASSNSSNGTCGSSSGLGQILSADVLSPSTIEMLSKEMLVDETYEFGACENCVESEHECEGNEEAVRETDNDVDENVDEEEDEDEEDEYGDFEHGVTGYSLTSNLEETDGNNNINNMEKSLSSVGGALEENVRLNLRLNLLNLKSAATQSASEETSHFQSKDAEIIKYLGEDNEWEKYQQFCSNVCEDLAAEDKETGKSQAGAARRRQQQQQQKDLLANKNQSLKLSNSDETEELDDLLNRNVELADVVSVQQA